MAKNKRKFKKKSVEKIQKIKSLNNAIHFPSVSFSHPKQQHRGSQSDFFIPKSKQKSLLERMTETFTASASATTTRTFIATTTQLRDLSYLNLNRVSNMNSKNSEIPFKLAKNKRKVSINLVKKIQKIKSLNKACLLYTSPSPRD